MFYFVQSQKPKSIIDQNNKQASQLSIPYKNPGGDNLTTPAQDANSAFSGPNGPQSAPTSLVSAPTAMTEPVAAKTAIINTTKGSITISLYGDIAPKTVSNFVSKAKSGYYANLTFHRVEDWVIQGGDPKGDGTGGGDMPTEFNDKPFVVGSVGVARRSDPKVQNDSQFFITKSESSWLNGQYTNFGIVTSGMDIVNSTEIGDKILSITVE